MGRLAHCALAARLRPQCLDDVVGQDCAVRALRSSINAGYSHSAYCLMGPRGTGKTSLSRILSKCLNCSHGITDAPCHACTSCRDVDEGRRVDYVEVDAASNRGVDQMCALLSSSSYAPLSSRHRIYAIDEAHMLTPQALTSMLKTLEEPPVHVKFILCTTDAAKIPSTVRSRALGLCLPPLSTEDLCRLLRRVLREHCVPFRSSALSIMAAAAHGSAREAIAAAEWAAADALGGVLSPCMACCASDAMARAMLEAIAYGNAPAVQAACYAASALNASPSMLLDRMMRTINDTAMHQCIPGLTPHHGAGLRATARMARAMGARRAQAMYRTLLFGKRELRLSCGEHTGLSMVALRAMAV
ncbi:DNA polymerase III subunit tau [Candidatus Tremblaya princeps]|uniref:DNA polymerase III subunit gamma/tau n=1 Tax=Tremblaya princeps TaxID=189385 RepID=A0A143WNI5_TREPR|nr:DNA polymerase III subunit tau [Candidatus Tremblaya princeps]